MVLMSTDTMSSANFNSGISPDDGEEFLSIGIKDYMQSQKAAKIGKDIHDIHDIQQVIEREPAENEKTSF